jgi:hypothetical protein
LFVIDVSRLPFCWFSSSGCTILCKNIWYIKFYGFLVSCQDDLYAGIFLGVLLKISQS